MLFLKILYAKHADSRNVRVKFISILLSNEKQRDCKNKINAPRIPVEFNRTLCFEYVPSTNKIIINMGKLKL